MSCKANIPNSMYEEVMDHGIEVCKEKKIMILKIPDREEYFKANHEARLKELWKKDWPALSDYTETPKACYGIENPIDDECNCMNTIHSFPVKNYDREAWQRARYYNRPMKAEVHVPIFWWEEAKEISYTRRGGYEILDFFHDKIESGEMPPDWKYIRGDGQQSYREWISNHPE